MICKILKTVAVLSLATAAIAANNGVMGGEEINTNAPINRGVSSSAGGYADFINNTNPGAYVTQCSLGSSGIISTQCTSIQMNVDSLQAISMNGNYAYFASDFESKYLLYQGYTQCSNPASGLESQNCVNIALVNPGGDFYDFQGIAFNGDYAYILALDTSNSNIPVYFKCSVNSSGIEPNQCTAPITIGSNLTTTTAVAVTFNNNFAYISLPDYNELMQCSIDSSGNLSTSCSTYQPQENPDQFTPNGVAFNGGFGYISNGLNGSYLVCPQSAFANVSQTDYMNQCSSYSLNSNNQPFSPSVITFDNGIAYILQLTSFGITNYNYLQCNMNGNGSFTNCNSNATSPSVLSMPSGIAFTN